MCSNLKLFEHLERSLSGLGKHRLGRLPIFPEHIPNEKKAKFSIFLGVTTSGCFGLSGIVGQCSRNRIESQDTMRQYMFLDCVFCAGGRTWVGRWLHARPHAKYDISGQESGGSSLQMEEESGSTKGGKFVGFSRLAEESGSTKGGKFVAFSRLAEESGSTKGGKFAAFSRLAEESGSTKGGKFVGFSRLAEESGSTKGGKFVAFSRLAEESGSTKGGKFVGFSRLAEESGSTKGGKFAAFSRLAEESGSTKGG